ncbi:hypothetical protein [Coleofasciculus sp. FACHB-SPT9]|uniref:hypothetical protein n=1 Tax=Coleofasciculus sp. FACHB-SPT9 TaxID=2692791 RepID=UPI0016831034|nr:hypothetical protein [Coleofasciculus sp. FACHB-SPT9]
MGTLQQERANKRENAEKVKQRNKQRLHTQPLFVSLQDERLGGIIQALGNFTVPSR